MNTFNVRGVLTLLLILSGLLSIACSDDNKSRRVSTAGEGAVSVALTDAASDDIESFEVTITGMTLTRANGTRVSLLTEDLRVDLVTLSEMSQIVASLDIHFGAYKSGSITIDYSDARVRIAGETSDAAILDVDGNDLRARGEVETEITILNGSLVVVSAARRIVEFDFDLDSSVIVDVQDNTVIVQSSVLVRVDRPDPKPFVLIGELASVDEDEGTFDIRLRRPGGAVFATVTCDVSSSTVFQVDGQPLTGPAGLSALATAGAGVRVQALATADHQERHFNVFYVEAGAGTFGSGQDYVAGHVVARVGGAGSDAVLTVRGHSLSLDGSGLQFNTSFTVNTDFSTTAVVRRGSAAVFNMDAINVGQAVQVYGDLSGTVMSATATGSLIRMHPTRVFGFASAEAEGGLLLMDVTRIGLRAVAQFDFQVDGINDADPAAFEVDIGSLSAAGIAADTPVEVRGFFNAVDSASADFEAISLSNYENAVSAIRLRWNAGTSTALSFGANSISIDTGAADLAVLDRGFVGSVDLSGTVTVSSDASGANRLFIIVENGSVALTSTYAVFKNNLETRISANAELVFFWGLGTMDSGMDSFTSNFQVAVLKSP